MTKVATPWPRGDGEMAGRIRSFDWAATPLGPIARWPQSLRTIVDLMLASPSMMSLVWGEAAIHLYNDRFTELLREHRTLALGRSAYETFAGSRDVFEGDIAAGMAGRSARLVAQRYPVLRQGRLEDAWFDTDYAPVRDEAGAVAGVLWTLRETTAQHLAERALRVSETRHRLLIESWAQAVWETDAAGVVVTDSPSWRAYTGQTREEWLGYGWLEAIHPDDRADAERKWLEALRARRPVEVEYRLRSLGGGWRWTNVRASPVLDAEGAIEKWVGLNIDIDARKSAEARLRISEARYRSLFDSMGQGYAEMELIRDADGRTVDLRYIELNPSFERLTGVPVDEARGRTVLEVLPDFEEWWFRAYERIVRQGRPERLEYEVPTLGRWYQAYVYPQDDARVTVLYEDISDRKAADAARHASEERQAFLLSLGDAMRSEVTASDKIRIAARLLGERLNASRVLYAEYDWGRGVADIFNGWFADGAQPFPSVMRLEAYEGQALNDLRAGRTVRVDHVGLLAGEPGFAAIAEVGVQALLSPPLMIDGTLAMNLSVHQHEPRHWTDAEVALVQEVAERLWAEVVRARAEAALRESEERFQHFAKASAAGLWIRDAGTLAMEYVSPAISTIYGIPPDAMLGDPKRWAALIVPEDRDTALAHLEQARAGEAVVHEFRVQRPVDGSFRWIRNVDFPLHDNGRIARIGGIAEDVTETKLAAEHSAVLLAELQHRVRNIMAMIRSITARTGERAESVPDYAALMAGRLLTLARVQALLTRAANAGVGILGIVRGELAAQALHEGQYTIDGPDLVLAPKAAEVLTLAVHELTTNALKYGGLSVPDGHVTVRWATFERRGATWLGFDWNETGAPASAPPDPATPRRRGFGSELIEGRVPYELRGRGRVDIEPGGARCHLEFPLRDGDSILETDAPQRATVFGGSIDMTGEADLTGHRVLVIEDDYYLATDTARALQGAGADVLGPCPDEDAARDELADGHPDVAVLDINLGSGPSFKLAETLKDRGIPFIFTTGYDPEVIPVEFDGVARLQKPLQLRQIVAAVSKLLPHTT